MNHSISSTNIPFADIIATPEQALETAHRLAERFAVGAARRDRDRLLPHAELALFSQSGLWGIAVPKEYGGPGLSAAVLAQVIAIIAAADGSLAQIPQNHFYILEALRISGSDAQKRVFFNHALAGERFGNALSETGTRTVGEFNTTLTRDSNGYRLNGRKFYSTGALYAHWIPVVARSPEDANKLFVAFVRRDAPGVTVVDDWSGFGQRTTGSGTTTLDNVAVAASEVISYSAAFDQPSPLGPFGQLIHAAIDAGLARGAFEDGLRFVRERSRPWIDSAVERAADDPLTIHAFGQIQIRLHAAEALLERAGHAVDQAARNPDPDHVAAASLAVAEARALTTTVALQASSKLFELAGTQSVLAEHNLDRHWRNARTHTLHDPVRWKYYAVGNFYLNGVFPARHGAL